MTNTVKEVKLLQIWKENPDQVQEERLKLELKASRNSAQKDLIVAEEKALKQEGLVLELEQKLVASRKPVGSAWHPANIVNAEIELEEAKEIHDQLKANVKRIKELILEYLGESE